ncbi:HU family DNA-binding protein [Pseudonocardia sp.]|uniref:HU family DNA-binding protein n=1 Tax=Pseudonocardia sp. TaxID=60912 RepID=UPI003D121716
MNKTQLVEAVTARIGDRRTAQAAVDGVLETIVRTVGAGESVSLAGFGVFESRARAARTARNPRTGEAVAVPATTVPAFRPGAGFRAVVAGTAASPPAALPGEPFEPKDGAAPVPPDPRNGAAPKSARRTRPAPVAAAPAASPIVEAAEVASEPAAAPVRASASFAADAPEVDAVPPKPKKAVKTDKAVKAVKTDKAVMADKAGKGAKASKDAKGKPAKGKAAKGKKK